MTNPNHDEGGAGLPWKERVTMLSINPDAASREDIANMAAELMETWHPNPSPDWVEKAAGEIAAEVRMYFSHKSLFRSDDPLIPHFEAIINRVVSS